MPRVAQPAAGRRRCGGRPAALPPRLAARAPPCRLSLWTRLSSERARGTSRGRAGTRLLAYARLVMARKHTVSQAKNRMRRAVDEIVDPGPADVGPLWEYFDGSCA